MTGPAQDFAIGKPIAAIRDLMMGLPSTLSRSSSFALNQSVRAPSVGMLVALPPALTAATGPTPCEFNCFVRERHFI